LLKKPPVYSKIKFLFSSKLKRLFSIENISENISKLESIFPETLILVLVEGDAVGQVLVEGVTVASVKVLAEDRTIC
jgi:hypothetical protein